MSDRMFTTEESVEAYVDATRWWIDDVLPAADPAQLDGPGLGVWTVRELIAHTTRAFKTTVQYAAPTPATGPGLLSASEYFRVGLAAADVHAGVADRGRQEALDNPDVIAAAIEWSNTALDLVATQAPDSTAKSFAGVMRFDQYLATRSVELVVHGLDLATVVGRSTQPPRSASSVALAVLIECVADDDLERVLAVLTGRGVLGPDFSVFG